MISRARRIERNAMRNGSEVEKVENVARFLHFAK